ncbi:MAG: alpha/beta fold hydrolase [Acidimicrobiales bacterium]
MTPAELRIATGDGTVLRALHWTGVPGGGIPMVLVHGLASNCRLWDGAARELVALGHDVVALDLRGHGRSDKPDHGYSVPEVARDVVDVIGRLSDGNSAWERPLVLGQSWGGNIVVEIAANHAGRVRGAVAVDGGTIELSRAFPDWEECSRTLAPPRLAGMPAERLRTFVRGAHPDWSEEAIDGTMHNMEHHADGTISPWLTFERHITVLRGLWEHSPTALFPRIEVPVLFTPASKADDQHTRTKRESHARALELVPRARVEWFEPADHDLHAQFPARFASTVHRHVMEGFLA